MKAQSAIEYLMTYGWMLLVVAVTGTAIFSVTSSQEIESSSGFSSNDLNLNDFGLNQAGNLQIDFRNTGSDTITVTRVEVTDNDVKSMWGGDKEISISDNAIIEIENITQGSNSNTLDVNVVYSSGGLSNLETSGTITGSLKVSEGIEANSLPVAQFSINDSSPKAGRVLEVNASNSYDSDSTISSYEWDWNNDDVFEKSGITSTNTYNNEGEKNISLKVIDAEGSESIKEKSIQVESSTVTIEGFELQDLSNYTGDKAAFSTVSSAEDGAVSPIEGTYMLQEASGTGSNEIYVDGSNLKEPISQGNVYQFYYAFGKDGGLVQIRFGGPSQSNSYNLIHRNYEGSNTYDLKLSTGGSTISSSSSGSDWQTEAWYKTRVDWRTNGTMFIDVERVSDGFTKFSFSGTDNTYTSGGLGFGGGSQDHYFDKMIRE